MPRTSRNPRVRAKASRTRHKPLKHKALGAGARPKKVEKVMDPRQVQQLKLYEEGARLFNQQKFHRAREVFEKVAEGYSRELADRARVHLRICEQRIARAGERNPRSVEEHYHAGIAMMNLGRWDEAREFLEKARKLASKADYIYYALAALDCLTGEADAALENLKTAIDLRPENRYHARNDEDFAFLLEDPRFTELLYPERENV
jgi:tetratricopeptide (TPR) repeat protein